MRRIAIGILLGTLAGYAWGMVYWGFNPLPYTAWKHASDDVAAGAALREHFPETGTYYLPAMHHDREKRAELYSAGPVAFVHVTSQGRPENESAVMIKGFFLVLATTGLLAAILLASGAAQRGAGACIGVAALVGAAAALVIDIGDAVWWYIPLEWKLFQAFYDFTAFLVPGAVLAKFVSQPAP